jgi:DNA uptake protein ComE-like DNA-binding protein
LEKLVKFFQGLLSLSHAESKGFIKLLIVCLVAIALLYVPEYLFQGNLQATAEDARILDSLANELERKSEPRLDTKLFNFDPNFIAVDSLILLGFERDIALRIDKYRGKGGRFLVKSDLKKIYGLSEQAYQRVVNYIDLPDSLNSTAQRERQIAGNLNEMNAAELEKLRLIGRVLAGRIVRYRELLGGYVTIDQLYEVYGLPEDAVRELQKSVFIKKNFRPRMIRVNHDALDELKKHPYISDVLARDIVRFREINAAIGSEKVLANFKSIDKSSFEKLILYLDFR